MEAITFGRLLLIRLKRIIRATAVLHLLLFAALLFSASAYSQDQDPKASMKMDQNCGLAEKAALKDKWGVEVTAIRLTSSDHMIDFRYKVYDVAKAAPLFKREIKPQLIHSATGKVLSVPVPAKVGALRTTEPPQAGRTYWMLFGNGGNLVKKGNEVSVVIGEFRADKLIVE